MGEGDREGVPIFFLLPYLNIFSACASVTAMVASLSAIWTFTSEQTECSSTFTSVKTALQNKH